MAKVRIKRVYDPPDPADGRRVLGQALADFEKEIESGPVTLVYGARDPEHNQARVLADYLNQRQG